MATARRRGGGAAGARRGPRSTSKGTGTQRASTRSRGGVADLRAVLQEHAADWERWGQRVRTIVNRVTKTCCPNMVIMDTITNPPKPPFRLKR